MPFLTTPDFRELLARVASALDHLGIELMVVGGQAVLLHGDPLDPTLRGAGDQAGSPDRDGGKGEELDRAYLSRWARAFSVVPGREELPEVLQAMFG